MPCPRSATAPTRVTNALRFVGGVISHYYYDDYPLPPLAEQQRIVAKVDELLALCDELDHRQTHRQTVRVATETAALHALTTADSPAALGEAWTRVRTHWSALTAHPTSVPPLRQAILQLAVQGKLVPQDASDEPASELLKRIAAEKARLVKAKEIREPKPLPPIDSEGLPFAVPEWWEWCRLGELILDGPTNGYSPRAVEGPTPVKSLLLSATTSGTFDPAHSKFIDEEVADGSPLWLRPGDFLVQRSNTEEYVGVSAVFTGGLREFIYPDLIMRFRPTSLIYASFLHYAMNSPSMRDYLRSKARGTSKSMVKINQIALRSSPIPTPSLAEQQRIVAKVDELMALCDELETHLTQQETTATHLATAAVQTLAS